MPAGNAVEATDNAGDSLLPEGATHTAVVLKVASDSAVGLRVRVVRSASQVHQPDEFYVLEPGEKQPFYAIHHSAITQVIVGGDDGTATFSWTVFA